MKNIDEIKKLGKANNVFYFKQFSVRDDRSTMKVGTDAVLLGIAAGIGGAEHILEVGTGCGVIALILAQRSSARIDALEIDEESVAQARENVAAGPWSHRISIIHAAVQDYSRDDEEKYDLIVSNPPFFSGTFKSGKGKRNISRHNESLTFAELVHHTGRLLKDSGSLWVILPVRESLEFIEVAGKNDFQVHYMLRIIPKTGKEHNRMVLQLKREEISDIKIESLTHWAADGVFSEEFKRFTGEFYIDF